MVKDHYNPITLHIRKIVIYQWNFRFLVIIVQYVVEFLKQVEISGKQPHFNLIFPNKTTSVAMNLLQY
jgi:hypothetical protein